MITKQVIAKEDLVHLSFPSEDVLSNEEDRIKRKLNIARALALGNLERIKARIAFHDAEGIKEVKTTIWGVTDKDIILKKGVLMPISRIVSINVV